jgi:hypothetical protein
MSKSLWEGRLDVAVSRPLIAPAEDFTAWTISSTIWNIVDLAGNRAGASRAFPRCFTRK